jgi:hypothetical protein
MHVYAQRCHATTRLVKRAVVRRAVLRQRGAEHEGELVVCLQAQQRA